MPLGSQWCCSVASACMGRHRACVSCTTPSCCCGSLEGARASTGLCVDVSSGVMISMKVIIICSRSQ